MTTVEKEQFWTQIVENPSLWGTIQTSDKSFNTQAENIWTVMNETFIKNGSLKEVNRWELMLGDRMENSGEGTHNERKSRILKRITEHPPITKGVVKDKLGKIIPEQYGRLFKFEFDDETDTLNLDIACVEENKEIINEIISDIVPRIKQVNITYIDLLKYANCVTLDDIIAVNADYKNDLTADGEWIYPLDNFEGGVSVWENCNIAKFAIKLPKVKTLKSTFGWDSTKLSYIDLDVPLLTYLGSTASSTYATTIKINAPSATNGYGMCSDTKLAEKIYINAPLLGLAQYGFLRCNTLKRIVSPHDSIRMTNGANLCQNCSNLEDFPWELPFLSNAVSMFTNTILNKKSTLRVLNSIPKWSDAAEHAMTMGIHIDNQSDEEVLTAIANAEAKGWTMTIQWNGKASTQTASTFGLRKPTIYAKVVDTQLPNGEPKQDLDWGHYATSWEENGYQEFSSLDEAYEYFGIEKDI